MTVKAKRFRIGVEGATTDGREIQREWLEQMAASYNPAVYTALINLEHIKSYLPDSTFNRYGKVTALFAEEITEGPLAGKMALYADVEPTESLVELVKKGQKLFTSMEVSPKFADTGKAYLVGLAATDDPASLGTEMLTFSASAREPAKKESTTVKRKRRTKKQKKEPEAKQGDYLVGTDENVLVLNRTYANRSNAERAAKMQWERLQRGVASFSLQLAEGRADLYTEMPVKVSGFKQPIDDAEWTITTLTHTVSPNNGFTTSLELEVKIDDFEME
ncbi:TPA: GPO family capsid scaffolding protein [Escherichia coli]